jgi:hypothetical protein
MNLYVSHMQVQNLWLSMKSQLAPQCIHAFLNTVIQRYVNALCSLLMRETPQSTIWTEMTRKRAGVAATLRRNSHQVDCNEFQHRNIFSVYLIGQEPGVESVLTTWEAICLSRVTLVYCSSFKKRLDRFTGLVTVSFAFGMGKYKQNTETHIPFNDATSSMEILILNHFWGFCFYL